MPAETRPRRWALRCGVHLHAGKYTVPVLWDKKTSTIVNNESAVRHLCRRSELHGPHCCCAKSGAVRLGRSHRSG